MQPLGDWSPYGYNKSLPTPLCGSRRSREVNNDGSIAAVRAFTLTTDVINLTYEIYSPGCALAAKAARGDSAEPPLTRLIRAER